jgi:hypothetical protein
VYLDVHEEATKHQALTEGKFEYQLQIMTQKLLYLHNEAIAYFDAT